MSDTRQMVTFDRLKEIIDLRGFDQGHEAVVMSREGLEWLLRAYVSGFPLDEAWYRAVNSDIDQAIHSGGVKDATIHFVTQGYVEGRPYCPLDFDEAAYLAKNTDLKEACEAGTLDDLKAHFVQNGFAEGRHYK